MNVTSAPFQAEHIYIYTTLPKKQILFESGCLLNGADL